MKNKEKWQKELAEIALEESPVAVDAKSGKPRKCNETSCEECAFCNIPCDLKGLQKWAEEEYVE